MNDAYELLLSRLQRVHRGSNGQDSACCPAHEDRNPSLGTRLTPEGLILIRCRAGCSAAEIVAAVGMHLADLMPPRPLDTPDGPGGSRGDGGAWIRGQQTRDMLAVASREALIVAMHMEAEWRGEDITLEDEDRVILAVRRLREFGEEADPGHRNNLEDHAVIVAERLGMANESIRRTGGP